MTVKRIIATAWALASLATAHAADAAVTSPDGRVALRIAEDGTSFSGRTATRRVRCGAVRAP